ncbi:hypothetical protein HMI56_006752 [Coelomomyces lativittatus]|nr:hypothetical protein HMI56_006752 [Coelomomyces lativittatus]
MLLTGAWEHLSFKKYNFNTSGQKIECGYLHPLMKMKEEFRKIFFEMGFEEMPTNRYVESSFWNFDALFVPQRHPARDLQDTFFLANPSRSSRFPSEYASQVGQVHSEGGYGSIGYQYPWKVEEAEKLVLRTHTTAVSARMLYRLAQMYRQATPPNNPDDFSKGGPTPTTTPPPIMAAKYFSIDRVFRNESVDATHLAEFHQVEGVIAEEGLGLTHLIGFLSIFCTKVFGQNQEGQPPPKLRFKPTYNPYTEPSMEIFSYHDGLKRWVEIGNSGMFRPELLRPMGFPENLRVIAWGLSLERPTMIKYGIEDIRSLMGSKLDLNMIAHSPICRLDKKMGKEVEFSSPTSPTTSA